MMGPNSNFFFFFWLINGLFTFIHHYLLRRCEGYVGSELDASSEIKGLEWHCNSE